MPKPKKAIPSITKNVCLPEPIVRRVDIILFSELEGRVPHGAWSRFLIRAVENELKRMETSELGGFLK